MSREEAAGKAAYGHDYRDASYACNWEDASAELRADYIACETAALAAADAYDAANGIHRIALDELTKAMYDVDPLKFMGDVEPTPWEKLGPAWRALAKSKAEAVIARIAALREGIGE